MKVDKVDTIKKEDLKRAFLDALAEEKISGSVQLHSRYSEVFLIENSASSPPAGGRKSSK
jgi:hypothetical protein